MYRRERKPSKEEPHHKHKKNTPSFSSTLLDEIYRSIDNTTTAKPNTQKPDTPNSKYYKEKTKKHATVEDEETANFRRARLIEKWIEKEIAEKAKKTTLSEFEHSTNDFLFFSSTSCSNSDSSGQLSTASDSEFFGSKVKPKVSCFSSSKPKPIRINNANRVEHEDSYLFNDPKTESKNRAMKMYANLKKVKQPISPGMKLTNFINSIFTQKSKKVGKSESFSRDHAKSVTNSTCSSASSFSRSCLSKYSPRSREKMRNGVQRTVRFDPASVIVDRKKCGGDEEICERFGRPPLHPNAIEEVKLRLEENKRKVEGAKRNVGNEFSIFSHVYDEDEDEDERMSDASSDLFELDHLSLMGNGRFCEELPVYETTRFNTNRASFIR